MGDVKVREGAAVWRQIEGETVLLDLATSTYLGMNSSATVLWPLMVEGTTAGDLSSALQEAFDLDSDTATRDVEEFLYICRQHDLLEG